jgi:GntR family transcriptional regulator of vanillate catabolism
LDKFYEGIPYQVNLLAVNAGIIYPKCMKPPVTTTTAELVALLRERILAGEFAPGSRMHQVQLSESFGISRTPLREALAQLANLGLLVYEPNRGYAVRGFSVGEIDAAFAVRARLEGQACGLCARHGLGRDVIARLEDCVRRGDRVLGKGLLDPDDLAPYRQMNVEFHETILQESRNPFLLDFVRQCHNVPLASDRVFDWRDHRVILRSHDDHHRILRAIAERDAERADALMREHVQFAGQVLIRMLRETSVVLTAEPAPVA